MPQKRTPHEDSSVFARSVSSNGPPRSAWAEWTTSLLTSFRRDRDEFWKIFLEVLQKTSSISASSGIRPSECELALKSFQLVTAFDWFSSRRYFDRPADTEDFLELLTAGLFGSDLPASEQYVRGFSGIEKAQRGLLLSSNLIAGLNHSLSDLDEAALITMAIVPQQLMLFSLTNLAVAFRDKAGRELLEAWNRKTPGLIRSALAKNS